MPRAVPKPSPGSLLLLCVGAALGWSLHRLWPMGEGGAGGELAEEQAATLELAPSELCVRVTTAEVTRGELSVVLAAAGVVRAAPAAEHMLSTRAAGRVLSTQAAPGQLVHAGELLLSLDPLPLQGALAQARAALAEALGALADYELSGRSRQELELRAAVQRTAAEQELKAAQVERLRSLHAEGLSSDKALAEAQQAGEQARADRELAQAALASFLEVSAELRHGTLLAAREGAQAAVDEAARQLAQAQVLAPADGQLLAFRARAGMRLEAGEVFGELLAAEGRLLAFSVTASAALELLPGARVSWADANGHTRTGKLQSLSGELEPTTGLRLVLVEPDPGMPSDPPGLALRGELELRRLHDALLVPERAVLRANDTQVVVLAAGEHAHRVPVTVLGRHAGFAAIEGDLHAGERVILEGGYNLPEGARIAVDAARQP